MEQRVIKSHSQDNLWQMPAQSFNAWRARNDLPVLFDYFFEHLPRFQEWLETYGLSKHIFCHTVPTGVLFRGSGEQSLYDVAIDGTAFFNSTVLGDQPYTYEESKPEQRGAQRISYQPYLDWLKRVERKARPLLLDKQNDYWSNRFEYRAHGAFLEGDVGTPRAFLFRGFPVLKLGDCTISDFVDLNQRNLDFVDLDRLIVTGKWHGQAFKKIAFSSLWGLEIREAELYFVELFNCDGYEIQVTDSKIQDLWFVESTSYQTHFSTSGLIKIKFIESECGFSFDRCDVVGFVYTPTDQTTPTFISHNYRHLRTAYQWTGKRLESAEAYYCERQYERRAAWSPYWEHAGDFPLELGRYFRKHPIKEYLAGANSLRECAREVLGMGLAHLKMWLNPKYALRAAEYKLKFLALGFQELIWGYGERPWRVLGSAFFVISTYAVLDYHFLHVDPPRSGDVSFVASLYYSIVTFTTIGIGVPSPDTIVFKVLYATEALSGVFLLGLLVAAFSNRNRY